jgi:hypothetical protein
MENVTNQKNAMFVILIHIMLNQPKLHVHLIMNVLIVMENLILQLSQELLLHVFANALFAEDQWKDYKRR